MQQTNKMSSSADVGTAWLLLSHAGWLAISMACMIMGTSLLVFFIVDSPSRAFLKPLAIYCIVVGLLFVVWTAYAVFITWQSNRRIRNAVFGDFGFGLVMFLVANVFALNIWTLVDIAKL